MTRRDILKIMFALGAESFVTFLGTNAQARLKKSRRSGKLSLYNEHTKESIKIQYINKWGHFDKNACRRLNHFFRCYYDGLIHLIDPSLFMFLDTVRCRLGVAERPYQLFSGYRSPSYNRLLCCEDAGVAHHSYHTKGMAADICIEGVSLSDISTVAKRLKVGGVGSYSTFVHLDVGPVRTW